MEPLKQGLQVITKSGKVPATITGVCMRGNNISYEISYFSNNSYHQYWVYAFEFDVDDAEKSTPGFCNTNQITVRR